MRNGGDSDIGAYTEAGIPDLEGNVGMLRFISTGSPAGTGVFSTQYRGEGDTYLAEANTSVKAYGERIHFLASDSNDTYGRFNSVIPESAILIYGVYLGITSKI